VPGESSGRGDSVAKMLLESGARVAITGRDEKKLYKAAESLSAVAIRADVTNEADVQRTFREALQAFGHLDILVNNAGVGVFRKLVDMDRASFDAVFATNVTGAMLMGREAAKDFIQRNTGNLVNICSTASLRGAANGTADYASKVALCGLTDSLR